jgi:hypothetical protein
MAATASTPRVIPDFHWCCAPLVEGHTLGDVMFHNKRGDVTIGDRTFAITEPIDYTLAEVFVATRTHAYEQSLEIPFNGDVFIFSYDIQKRLGWWWFGVASESTLQIKNTATGEIWHFAWQFGDGATRRWHRLTPIAGAPWSLKISSKFKRARRLAFELAVFAIIWAFVVVVVGTVLLSVISNLVGAY